MLPVAAVGGAVVGAASVRAVEGAVRAFADFLRPASPPPTPPSAAGPGDLQRRLQSVARDIRDRLVLAGFDSTTTLRLAVEPEGIRVVGDPPRRQAIEELLNRPEARDELMRLADDVRRRVPGYESRHAIELRLTEDGANVCC